MLNLLFIFMKHVLAQSGVFLSNDCKLHTAVYPLKNNVVIM